VLKNRVLQRIFRPKRGDMVGGCRRLHNEDASPNIQVIESRRIR